MGKKGLYSENKNKNKNKDKKPMFHNVAPAGRPSTDPYGDIATGLSMVAIGGICHLWSKTRFTQVLFVLMCVVAVYLAGRGIMTIIKGEEKK